MVNYYYIGAGILLLVLTLFILIRKRKGNKNELVADEEVEKFIRKSMDEGHLNKSVKKVLLDAGWPTKLIDLTLEKVKNEPEKKLFGLISTGRIETTEVRIMNRFAGLLKQQTSVKEEIEKVAKEVYGLKQREEEFTKAKAEVNKVGEDRKIEPGVPGDVKKVLLIVDELLEKLPEEEVDKFAQSNDFDLYKNIMEKVVGQKKKPEEDRKKDIGDIIDLVKNKIITEKEARKMLSLPEQKEKPQVIIKEVIKEVPIKEEKISSKEKTLGKVLGEKKKKSSKRRQKKLTEGDFKAEEQPTSKEKTKEIDMAKIKQEIEKELKRE